MTYQEKELQDLLRKEDIFEIYTKAQTYLANMMSLFDEREKLWNTIYHIEEFCKFQNDKLCNNPLKNQKSIMILKCLLDKIEEVKGDE